MNGIKSWAMIICFVSVICTIVEMMVPSGKMEKMFKLIIGIFMLCSILIPLKNTISNISFDVKKSKNFIKDESKLKDIIDNQTETTAKENIKSIIKNFLDAKDIKPEKINIIMDTKQDNCISIKKIEVFLVRGDESKKDMIKKELEQKFEIKTDVIVGSG